MALNADPAQNITAAISSDIAMQRIFGFIIDPKFH